MLWSRLTSHIRTPSFCIGSNDNATAGGSKCTPQISYSAHKKVGVRASDNKPVASGAPCWREMTRSQPASPNALGDMTRSKRRCESAPLHLRGRGELQFLDGFDVNGIAAHVSGNLHVLSLVSCEFVRVFDGQYFVVIIRRPLPSLPLP
jgi:hypothetical protein